MQRYKWLLISILLPTLIYAQAHNNAINDSAADIVPNAGHYVVALIAGVILAVAFQLILTNLSVAAGLNVLSTATASTHNRGKNRVVHHNTSKDNDSQDNTVGETARTISSAFGIWTMVTASIALFFAAWLAGELSLTSNPMVGAVIGLVIWGLFYVVMMTIEVNAISSLVGSLVRMAATGLRSAYNMTSSVFAKSEEEKMADTAAKVVGAVREELFGDIDADDVKDQIQKYVSQLKPQKIDPHQIAMEFAKLLDETEIRAIAAHNGPFLDNDTIIATLRTHGYGDSNAKSIANGINTAFSKFKEESSTNKDNVSKVTDTAMRVAGMSPEEASHARMQIENYLRSTGKDELNPEAIKRDLERLASDPKGAASSLKERFSSIDKPTIASIIAQRQDISQQEAEKIVDQVYNVITQLTSAKDGAVGSLISTKNSVIEKLRNYMNSLGRPELEYDGVTHDIQRLFHDPKAGADALMRRLKAVDRDTIKSILASRRDISEEDAERIISKIEGARDNVMMKVEQMQSEVKRRLNEAKEEAIHQADEVRKTASTAAWWAFGTAVVSGVCAALGGFMSSKTFF
ncbi:MAG: hypothetical protein ACM34K_00950 [Bacillota bacterium]